jgi:enamine deaminase RidA (YjgF/YER057c/UK114 family)
VGCASVWLSPEYRVRMASIVQLIRSTGLAEGPYAHAATAPATARPIFLAGACPLNLDGTTAAPGDVAGQASQCVTNLIVALQAAGATLADAIYTRVLVASTNRADLVAAWTVVRAAFGDHDVPSTLTGVTVLGYPDQLVEIECVAAVVD